MKSSWIAERMQTMPSSGIRKIFELGQQLKNPVNLSIGQPHFDVPEPIKSAAIEAIRNGNNGYTVTSGIAELREKLKKQTCDRLKERDRDLIITSGTSGALTVTILATINPGDEVLVLDPYFVSYPHLISIAGGIPIFVNTYPSFEIQIDQIESKINLKTKAILFASPANPTGSCISKDQLMQLGELARKHQLILISDEIYRHFVYDQPFHSVAEFYPETIVVDGFGKSYGVTGWRLGYVHGPTEIIQEIAKIQQYTFVCAPSISQFGAIAALDYDTSSIVRDYRSKRDRLIDALKDHYELTIPGGAFYLFPKAPQGDAEKFCLQAIKHELLIIPGASFSQQNTHFRVSFAAKDEVLERGIDILIRLASFK